MVGFCHSSATLLQTVISHKALVGWACILSNKVDNLQVLGLALSKDLSQFRHTPMSSCPKLNRRRPLRTVRKRVNGRQSLSMIQLRLQNHKMTARVLSAALKVDLSLRRSF